MPTRLYFRGLVYDTSSGKLPGSGWDHLGNTEGGYGTTNSGQNGVLGYDLAYNPTTGRYLVVGDSGQTNYETYVAWSDKIDGPWTYYQDPTIYQKTTTGGGINAAIYVPSSGLFVIANDSGVIWTSPNGENGSWTLRYTSPVGLFVNKISIANGIVIVSCPQSTIIYSTDGGLNWTTANVGFTGTANACREVIWDGTRYIAVGQSGQLAYATTLTGTWTQTTVGITNSDCWTIAYSPTLGRYCVGMGNATVRTATSVLVGATWTAATGTFGGSVGMVRWANGRFVACGDGRSIGTSTNGTAFTVTQYNTSTTKADFWGVYNFTGGNTWFAVTEYYPSLVWESVDNGATWQPTGTENSNNAIVAGLASAERKGVYAAGATALSTLSITANTGATSHTRLSVTSIASTVTQTAFLGIFATSPLASNQTVGGGSIILNAADGESNLNLNFWVNAANIYVWRPSTGAIVGYVRDATNVSLGGTEPTVASTTAVYTTHITGITSTAVSALAGDVVVVELWARFTSGMATAYTANFAYDGAVTTTTENTLVTNHASFIEFTENLTFGNPPISDSRTEALTATDSSNSTVVSAGISASQAESVTADHTQDSTLIEGIEGFVTETVSANHSQDAELIKATVPYTITTGSFKPATEFINSATIPAGTVALGDTVFVLVGGLSWTEYPTTTLWFTDNSTITGTRLAGTLNSPCFALYAFYNIQKTVSFVGIQSGTPGVGNINTYSIWGCPNIYEANQVEGGSPNGTTTTNAPFIDFSSLTASASDNHIAFGVFSINGPIGDTFTQPSGWIAPPTRVGTTGGSATSNNTLAGAWNVFTGTTGTTYTPTINTTRTLSYGGIYYRISNPVSVAITETASASDSSDSIISEGVQESLNATDTLVGGKTEQTFHIEDASNGFVLNTLVGSTSIAYDTSINQVTLLNAIQGIRFISGQTGSLGEVRARLQRSATGNPLPGTPATLRLYSLNNNTLSGTPATALATFSFDIGQISTSGGIYTFDFADITGAQLVAGTAYGLMFEPGSDWSGTQYIQLGYNPSTTALARYSSGLYSYIDGKSSQNTYSTGSNAYMFFAKTTARVTDAVDSEILVNPPSVRTESVTATDSSARVITTSQTRTEAGSAIDSQAGSSVREADTSESVTANDSSSGSVASAVEAAESVTADHTQDFAYVANGAVTETGTAADSAAPACFTRGFIEESNNVFGSIPPALSNVVSVSDFQSTTVLGPIFVAQASGTVKSVSIFGYRSSFLTSGSIDVQIWQLASNSPTALPQTLLGTATVSYREFNNIGIASSLLNISAANISITAGTYYALILRNSTLSSVYNWANVTRLNNASAYYYSVSAGVIPRAAFFSGGVWNVSSQENDFLPATIYLSDNTTDIPLGISNTFVSTSESLSATDSSDGIAFQNNFQDETLTAVDSEDAVYTANSSIAETGSANHTQTNTLAANAWITNNELLAYPSVDTGGVGSSLSTVSARGTTFRARETSKITGFTAYLYRTNTANPLPTEPFTMELWELASASITAAPSILIASKAFDILSIGTSSSVFRSLYFDEAQNTTIQAGKAYALLVRRGSDWSSTTQTVSFVTQSAGLTDLQNFYNYLKPIYQNISISTAGVSSYSLSSNPNLTTIHGNTVDELLGGFSAFVDQTDSGAATDDQDAVSFQNNLRDETLTATDSANVIISTSADRTETGSAADICDRVITTTQNSTEENTAVDTATGNSVRFSDVTETVTSSDQASATFAVPVATSEVNTATDSSDNIVATNSSVTEAGSATDAEDTVVDYLVSASETGTATDTQDNTADRLADRAESVTATDAETVSLDWAVARTETLSVSDSSDNFYSTSSAAAETSAATDTPAATYITSSAITESVSPTDAQLVVRPFEPPLVNGITLNEFTFNATGYYHYGNLTDTDTAVDTPTAGNITSATSSETVTAEDSLNGSMVTARAVSEAVDATDSADSQVVFVGLLTDSVDAQSFEAVQADFVGVAVDTLDVADTQTTQADFVSSATESLAGSDSLNASLVAIADASEAGSVADSVASQVAFVGLISETGSASDTQASQLDAVAELTETGTTQDSSSNIADFVATSSDTLAAADSAFNNIVTDQFRTEDLAASDSVVGVYVAIATRTEAGAANDSQFNIVSFTSARTEAGSATDTQSNVATRFADLVESGNAADNLIGSGFFIANRSETVAANDSEFANFVVTVQVVTPGVAGDSAFAGLTIPVAGSCVVLATVNGSILDTYLLELQWAKVDGTRAQIEPNDVSLNVEILETQAAQGEYNIAITQDIDYINGNIESGEIQMSAEVIRPDSVSYVEYIRAA